MVFVDTSALMDGRIALVAGAGFMPGTLVVPRSVLAELQFLADQADSEKRKRARRGLDIVKELQDNDMVAVRILQDGVKAAEGVDNRLISLAKKYSGSICTNDFNLNKLATVEGIAILNVNELTKQLRMPYLPGDVMEVELTQKGSGARQAIGHLSDGTMVVVERADRLIGKTVKIEIIRSLQTDAGRMMFAKLVEKPANGSSPQRQKPQKNQKRDTKPKNDSSLKPSKKRPPTQEESLISLVNKQ
jgi:uncharacterized protein YacL